MTTAIPESDRVVSSRLYGRIWRWHFFAALVVVPFVLWQAITGTAYLWSYDFELGAHPELLSVAARDARASYDAQLATVQRHHPGEQLAYMQVSDDPSRSTAFFFLAANRLPYPAFVDPHTGDYLGSIEPARWLTGLSRSLHGGWPIEPYGSYLLELGASWTIVMILTGLYLWWPRAAEGMAGILYPRLRKGSRLFWRDLHSIVGMYFSLIVLAFLVTALPWTTFWGNQILRPIEQALGQIAPNEKFFRSGAQAQHHHSSDSSTGRPDNVVAVWTLDRLIARAHAEGVRGTLEVRAAPRSQIVSIRSRNARASSDVYLQLDRSSGAIISKAVWQDFPLLPKLVAVGVDLHEGTFFGRSNQIFNTVVAGSLVWLAVTGFIGWYQRRPRGGLAAPPKRVVVVPRAVMVVGGVLCVVLPMLGISVFAIAVADWIFSSRLQ